MHNVLNALACIAVCTEYGIDKSSIKLALSKFTGAHRRFEFKGKIANKASVYDDYGHHPTEIIATAKSLMNKKYNKSWVVFQPHTYSRTKNLLDDFAKALLNFDNIIILDIYENGVYDVQQELKFKYGNKLDLEVEIASITDKDAMSVVFEKYHPDIVINAAAHKHVPLMEHNCVEAIKNNVFGTENVLELCEEYGVDRFMMVSTDKAVNPTNVMGATKRMCEMIAQSYSTRGKVKCSCTRFGNVLGSAGSVIPLFKRQIAAGGPVTLTDKRIIRYFMTIPEASQLVLQSGAIAKNGEIFVLDMGQPIKIYDLAKNMIKLSAAQNIEIIETGLRPGEKLYEELLVRTDELDTTENDLIFVEKEKPISYDEVEQKLSVLKNAVNSKNNDLAREALRCVIPTFKSPEEVNKNAEESMEMNIVKTI